MAEPTHSHRMRNATIAAIVIGGSAGAIDALSTILPGLPPDFARPVLVVVHVPPDKASALTELFQTKCGPHVKEAEDKEPIVGGSVYFAPPNYHLLVERDFHLSLSSDEPVNYSRPAIDVLFESAADAYGAGTLGIVLSGASSDGAAGIAAICRAGGRALVQRPDTAAVATMPRAALEACPGAEPMTPAEIHAALAAYATANHG